MLSPGTWPILRAATVRAQPAIARRRSMKSAVLILVGAAALVLAGCGSTDNAETPTIKSPLVGQWESVAFEGADTPPGLQKVTFTFGADGAFKAVARGVEEEKELEQVREGSYRIADEAIEVTIPNEPTPAPTPFRFDGEELIVEDPNLESSIRLKRTGG